MTTPSKTVKTVLDLESALGETWSGIRAAAEKTAELRQRLVDELKDLEDPNCSIIVTGSLGRCEANDKSDADWLLLVDGPSNPDHVEMAREIERAITKAELKKPGATGTFGELIASHDLIHYIAGIRDTNENLTRRMLLLAESYAITEPMVRQRVIRNILARYVESDRSVQDFHPIPHFLLNDVVRYWRTIASDYASKMWDRNREGWATRNVKLRFSRKLLFAWGLLASFAGKLFPTPTLEAAKDADEYVKHLAALIAQQTDVTPLDLLSRAASHVDVTDAVRRDLFGAYDTFLTIMADPSKRTELDKVPFEQASQHEVYSELRTESHRFRDAINSLFFEQHPQLKTLIRSFGVF
jgi:predicted nucleotidyltransferase